ncbi:hypothetical protein Tco_0413688 [Tanacetum coccineum]
MNCQLRDCERECFKGYIILEVDNPQSVIMSSATSAVTYTSVYTDSEPGRAFWGADDEEPVTPTITRLHTRPRGSTDNQPVSSDEMDREPMFVHAHDPDYVPEPYYPEYIPLEDEHEFSAEEKPILPVDSPTLLSPPDNGYYRIPMRIPMSTRMMRQKMVRLYNPNYGEMMEKNDDAMSIQG